MSLYDPRTFWSPLGTLRGDETVAGLFGVDVSPSYRQYRTFQEVMDDTIEGAGVDVFAIVVMGAAEHGDVGAPMVFRWTPTEPAHPGKLHSNGGTVWWQLEVPVATPTMFQAPAGGVLDAHAGLLAACQYAGAMGREVHIYNQTFGLAQTLALSGYEDLTVRFFGAAWLKYIGPGGTDSALIELIDCPRSTWDKPHFDLDRNAWDAIRVKGSGAGNQTQSGGTRLIDGEIRDFMRYGARFHSQADNFEITGTLIERRWDGPDPGESEPVPVATPAGVVPACVRSDTVGKMVGGKLGGVPGWCWLTSTENEANGDPSLADAGRNSLIAVRLNAGEFGYVRHDANGKFTDNQATTLSHCYLENTGLRNAAANAGNYSSRAAQAFYASNKGRIVIDSPRKFSNNYAQRVFAADTGGSIVYREGAGLQGAQPEHAIGTGTTLWLNLDGTGKFYPDGLTLRDEIALTYDAAGTTGKQNAYFSRDKNGAGGGALGAFVSGQSKMSTTGYSIIPGRGSGSKLNLMDGTTTGWTASPAVATFTTGTDPAAWMQPGQAVIKITGDGTTGNMTIYRDLVLNNMKGQWLLARAQLKLTEGTSHPNPGAKIVISDPNRPPSPVEDPENPPAPEDYAIHDCAIAFQGEPGYGQEAFETFDTRFFAEDLALILRDVCTVRISIHLKIGTTFACDDTLSVLAAELLPLSGEF